MYSVHACGVRVVFLEHGTLEFVLVASFHLGSWTSLSASFAFRSVLYTLWASAAGGTQHLWSSYVKKGQQIRLQYAINELWGGGIGMTAATPAGPALSLEVSVVATTASRAVWTACQFWFEFFFFRTYFFLSFPLDVGMVATVKVSRLVSIAFRFWFEFRKSVLGLFSSYSRFLLPWG